MRGDAAVPSLPPVPQAFSRRKCPDSDDDEADVLDTASDNQSDDEESSKNTANASGPSLIQKSRETLACVDMNLIDPLLRDPKMQTFSGLDFMRHFSTTNKTTRSLRKRIREQADGGEIPRTFDDMYEYKCPNSENGCEYKNPRHNLTISHAKGCKYTTPGEGRRLGEEKRLKAERPFPCKEAGCSLAYETEKVLRKHLYKHRNPYIPRKCTKCSSEVVFVTRNALSYHEEKEHPKIKYGERKCGVSGSTSGRVSPTWPSLDNHLTSNHRVWTRAERNKYLYGDIGEAVIS